LGASLPPVTALHFPLQATEGKFEEFIGIKESHVAENGLIEFGLPFQPMKDRSDPSLKQGVIEHLEAYSGPQVLLPGGE
jgi:hypothetical protein